MLSPASSCVTNILISAVTFFWFSLYYCQIYLYFKHDWKHAFDLSITGIILTVFFFNLFLFSFKILFLEFTHLVAWGCYVDKAFTFLGELSRPRVIHSSSMLLLMCICVGVGLMNLQSRCSLVKCIGLFQNCQGVSFIDHSTYISLILASCLLKRLY